MNQNNKISKIKPALTAFEHFDKEIRPKLNNTYPNKTFNEISGIIHTKWNALNASTIKKYYKMQCDDVSRYNKEYFELN